MSTTIPTAPNLETRGSPFITHDSAFLGVIGDAPRLVKVVDANAHEGPVYMRGEDTLYFTTLPEITASGLRNVAIQRVQLEGEHFPLDASQVSTVVPQTRIANGMTLDHNGRLIVCEQGTRADHARISRLNPQTGALETVVDAWCGLRFNSPNDAVVKSDGSIWFTDPSYGFHQGFKPAPMIGDYVYRFDPRNSSLSVVADAFLKPNGLAFSHDESVLYVVDSGGDLAPDGIGPRHVIAFDVIEGRHLANARLFAVIQPGFPDGIKVDAAGRVYISSASGVQVYNPSGDLIGEIALPGTVNFTFGGPNHNVLFITNDTAIWAAVLEAQGAR
jgi:gluconolactonase